MKLYTLKQIAEQLGLPASTVRHYRDSYEDFFHQYTEGEGRGRRYQEEAIQILSRIAELSRKNNNATDITQALTQEFTRDIVLTQENNNNTTTITQHKEFHKLLEHIDHLQQKQQSLEQRLDRQEKFIYDSVEKRDKQLMEIMREMQNKKQPTRKWFEFWK